jgi:hypothetical protein
MPYLWAGARGSCAFSMRPARRAAAFFLRVAASALPIYPRSGQVACRCSLASCHHGTRIRSAAAAQALLPTLEGACLAMMNALSLGEIVMWIGRRRIAQALQSPGDARCTLAPRTSRRRRVARSMHAPAPRLAPQLCRNDTPRRSRRGERVLTSSTGECEREDRAADAA